jgi:hypothetical protein
MTNRFKCDCGWKSTEGEVLIAPHPFDPEYTVDGCPKCKDVNCFTWVCDEPDCWEDTTCGTPTKEGYRRTCSDHIPRMGGF